MESSGNVYHNIHLKKVLKSYQSAASSSLSGPNAILPAVGESIAADHQSEPRVGDEFRTLKLKRHKSQREVHPPILTAPDRSWTEWSETNLEGFPIACFVVGGEKRLCLPQVLNSVLGQFHISEINAVCDELHIYCSLCSPQQLEMLKTAGILPRTAPSCGLITLSDAQRLCSFLLRTPPRIPNGLTGGGYHQLRLQQQQQQKPGWFRVYHECFGKCEGICKPELYQSAGSRCIECADCGMLLAPQHFVSHAHRAPQNRTCHWGFDAEAWRAYLLLARRQIGYELLLRQLHAFKEKFAASASAHSNQTQASTTPTPTPTHGPGLGPSCTSGQTLAVSVKRKQKLEEPEKFSVDIFTIPKKCKEEPEQDYPHNGVWYPHPLLPLAATTDTPFYQPNVSLLPRTRKLEPAANPEIELSSTDTDDTDSLGNNEPDKTIPSPSHELLGEISRVEDLLRAGNCNPKESLDILQAFRRLCYRVAVKEKQLDTPLPVTKWEAIQMTGVKREPQPLDYS